MKGIEEIEEVKSCPTAPRGAARRRRKIRRQLHRYPGDLRLKAVKLHVEEGYPVKMVGGELGVSPQALWHWVQVYRTQGEAGLMGRLRQSRPGKPQLPAAVHEEIVRIKQTNPAFGVRKIAHWLRRVLCLPGSAETVRRTLHRRQLLPKTKPKRPPRNPQKPRFFERATPNQMWQSDICCFRMGGQNAYLIGFMDDHSRYLVGLDVFRSQTGEHVLEVYRTAAGEYGVPKEMLTDNGRQYASWRGKTRFQQELQKDHIHHIRSQPHHPMTLGKIERFWKTIWEDFLGRAQFDSFESARERIRLWAKYYNFKRPHQGLDGSCPADRFFSIQQPLRKAIEQSIQENILELALRGQPKNPFYMVGRMGGQSLVMQLEKGKLKMLVDGEENRPVTEVVYDMEGTGHEQLGGKNQEGTERTQRPGEVPGRAGGVDAAAAAGGSLPGNERAGEPDKQLAGPGAGGYAPSVGTADAAGNGPGTLAGAADGAAAGAQAGAAGNPDRPAGDEAPAGGGEGAGERVTAAERIHEPDAIERCADPGNPGGMGGAVHGDGSSPAPEHLPQDVLPVGEAGDGRPAPGRATAAGGPAADGAGSGAESAGTGESPVAGSGGQPAATSPHPELAGRGC